MGNALKTGEMTHVDVRDVDSVTIVGIQGQVTEDSALLDVLSECVGRAIVVDSSKLTRINSCGVRDWVRWIKGLEERGNRVFFIRCSPFVVAQLNMISNFAGTGHVLSFQAPFVCTECGREESVTLNTSEFNGVVSLPDVSCLACGRSMEFDEISESYFEFARNHARRVCEDVVKSVVQSL